jgi:hypothetical protein
MKLFFVNKRTFRPSILNCASGLLTVLLNVYSACDGTWLPIAWVTLAIVIFSLTLMISVLGYYRFWIIRLP